MAEKSKNGFIVLLDFYEPLQCLTDAQKGQVFDACFAYHLGKELELNDPLVKMAFSFLRPFFDRQKQAYDEKCAKNRANAFKKYERNDTEANGCDGMRTDANASDGSQIKVKVKAKTEIKDKDTPPISPSGGGVREPYSDDFNEFWNSYPKKTGKDAAWRAWCTKRREKRLPSVGELITKLDEFRETEEWQKEGGRFIPNPATWINQARWMDELTEGGLTAAEKERILESMRRANRAYRQNI